MRVLVLVYMLFARCVSMNYCMFVASEFSFDICLLNVRI
jgi:hypothetical protein